MIDVIRIITKTENIINAYVNINENSIYIPTFINILNNCWYFFYNLCVGCQGV